MSYEDLLRKNRFAQIGDPFFQGEVGEYFMNRMKEIRRPIGAAINTAASKKIGWDS